MLTETQNLPITSMTTDQILAERRVYEEIIKSCKYETPQQVCEVYEAYTLLIWKHHQIGLINDCYYDEMIDIRDNGANLEGSDQVVYDTLAQQGRFPDINTIFEDIYCVGNKEDGYCFGQVVYDTATVKGGVSKFGIGTEGAFMPYECLEICECHVKFIDGKWRMAKEYGVRSSLGYDRALQNLTPPGQEQQR